MDAETRARSRTQSLDEVWKWTVGLGIVGVALFPLALPIVILTVVAVLPLAVPLLALALLGVAVALPVVLLRKAGRSLSRISRRRRPPTRPSSETPAGPAPKPVIGR